MYEGKLQSCQQVTWMTLQVFFPCLFGHSDTHTQACCSTAKSSSTDRAMWDLHLGGAVSRCGMKMHPKCGFFSRRSWPSFKTPMAHQSILAEFQSINISWQDGEMERRLLRVIWVGKTNTSRSKLKKIFLLTCLLCACFLWNHFFSCLYRYLTLKIWPEDLKPLFVALETQSHLVIVARIKACFQRCVLLKCYTSQCFNIRYFPCGIGWTHSNSDHFT